MDACTQLEDLKQQLDAVATRLRVIIAPPGSDADWSLARALWDIERAAEHVAAAKGQVSHG